MQKSGNSTFEGGHHRQILWSTPYQKRVSRDSSGEAGDFGVCKPNRNDAKQVHDRNRDRNRDKYRDKYRDKADHNAYIDHDGYRGMSK